MKKKIEGIIHRPFAPPIGQYNLTEKSTAEINKYIDNLRTNEKELQLIILGIKLEVELLINFAFEMKFLRIFY